MPMRPAAGTEQVRPLTGSVASLAASAGGLRAVAIQARRADGPAPAEPAVALPGPAAGIRSVPAVGAADTAVGPWAVQDGGTAPNGPPVKALTMPAPRLGPPLTVQTLGPYGAPVLPPTPAAPILRSPPSRTAQTPATAVQRAGGIGLTLLEAAGSELGSARQAAESAAARELGTARPALETAASRGLEGAQEAVHQAAGAVAGPRLPESEVDVDALAGRLYDRIRSRLRSELLISRERAGQVTDLR